MAFIIRLGAALLAVITGLPLLVSALAQSLLLIGYDSKPEEAIKANFLEGNTQFIEEAEAEYWSVGYSKEVLTPDDIDSHRYFLGGYLKFPAQEATGVIDDISVRAVVLDDNSGRGAVAFAWVDTVGLMNADIKDIREKLRDITGEDGLIAINVGATHAHSAIDTQGLWGNIPKSGRDDAYIACVVEKTAKAIRDAYTSRTQGQLYYASKSCPQLFADGRKPDSLDDKVHLFRFVPNDTAKNEIYIANFGGHPVNLPWENTQISADFPGYLDQTVSTEKNADFIFIQGAIGGGIYVNLGVENGIPEELSGYDKMKEYCHIMADLFTELVEKAAPVEPILNIRIKQIDFEIDNFLFKLVERANLCNAIAYKENGAVYMPSEIGYVEIGKDIKILQVPGEVLPEIVYGNFFTADESLNGTEYPYPALNTYLPEDDDILVFGLCNDAVGYIVPDNDYGSAGSEGHYEESVSTGSKSGTTLSKAFIELFESLKSAD